MTEATKSKKCIVITGASAGIGAAAARTLAERGYAIVLAARGPEALAQVAASCGENALAVATDVTKRADVERLKESALETFGRIDVWINNAGRGISRSVLELTDEDIDEMMLVNVKSAVYGMQVCIPYFKEKGAGHLINVSSFLSRVPIASHRSAYSAAKAALSSLTTNLRMELTTEYPKVSVTLLLPGVVDTEFSARAINGSPQPTQPPGVLPAQSTAEVAKVIADVIENPVAERYTNPQHPKIVADYYSVKM